MCVIDRGGESPRITVSEERGQSRLISRKTGSPLAVRDFVTQTGHPRGAIHEPNICSLRVIVAGRMFGRES